MQIAGNTGNIAYQHPHDAGADLKSCEDTIIPANGHTHAHDPLEFGGHHNEINIGLDAWHFEPVNEAELVDNWLQTALSVTE